MFFNFKPVAVSLCGAVLFMSSCFVSAQTTAVTSPTTATSTAGAITPAAAETAPATSAKLPEVKVPVLEENPYGIKAVLQQGDMVAKGTLLILIIMSMASWFVIFSKYFEQSKVKKAAKAVDEKFWASTNLTAAVNTLHEDSPFRFIADKGLASAGKHTGLMGGVDLNTWVSMGIQRAMGTVQSRLQGGLAVLATVGSTAPFVGLFGTVWGIYNALVKIGMSGQASIDKVAGPVGESLIMTAIGLAVAVPAVLGYNWLVRRNKGVMDDVHAFGNDLHSVLIATGKQ
jgi:biopolymer transport protein ExbB